MSKNKTAAEYIQENLRYAYKFGGSIPTPTTYGIWEVRGADQNCGIGGSHHTPLIGYFEGTFEDVYNLALTKPSTRGWSGFEAEIKLINVIKVDSNTLSLQAELIKEKKELEHRLKEIEQLTP